MSLPSLSIKKPVFTWMLMFGLIFFGGLCFQKMGVSQMPDVDFPVVSIGFSLQGAAPEIIEADIVDVVEESLTSIQGITNISSTSRTGSANISVEFGLDKNIDVAIQEVQTVLGQIVRRLPKETEAPSVRKSNPEDQPILWLAVSSTKHNEVELMSIVRDQIKDQFSTIDGVGEINLGGYTDPALRVWISGKKLQQYALTVNDIISTIDQEHNEQPSGRIESPLQEINIRTLGEAPSAEDFGRININKRGGSPNYAPLPLSAVAKIEDGLDDIRRKTRSNGEFAIGLGVKKQRGANAVAVAEAVIAKVSELNKNLPEGVVIGVRNDSTRFIKEAVHELNFTLILSAILTAFVCWLFLGSWTATLNVVLAIPTSIVGSFICLYALGFTLNTFTLLGLSLAIGIVVDDAIMVLENIVRHLELGEKRRDAALNGAEEIAFAAMAATAAIIAIFLPVAFMKGIIGKFFFQFGVTLTVAVALSLLEALTLTPMRSAQFLSYSHRTGFIGKLVDGAFVQGERIYGNVLKLVLRNRTITVFISLVFFVGSFSVVRLLKKEFVPPQDQGSLSIRVQAAAGSSLRFTDEKMIEIEKMLQKNPSIKEYFSNTGGGSDVNSGFIFVTLKTKKDRAVNPETKDSYTQQELLDVIRADLKTVKKVRAFVSDPSLSGFSSRRGAPVEFSLRGPNWDQLVEFSKTMMEEMDKSKQLTDIDSDYKEGLPEIKVIPDREKARLRGVSMADIGSTINAMVGGVTAGKFSKNGRRYDIKLRLDPDERSQMTDINRLFVRNNRGELISLADLVQLKESKSLQAIARQDRERAITISANLGKNISQDKAIEMVHAIADKTLSSGYRIVVSGSAKSFQESFDSLILALLLGLIVSYMVLASQFNSFIHPFTVLMALPFSLSGAFLALLIANKSINIYSMIGLILLMGITKKNSILLVDFTNQMKAKGLETKEALIKACPIRLRPILMTSFATIAGALPSAFAFGPGAESRIPMAITVIGGVLFSTILTLIVVPCVYSFLSFKEKPLQSDGNESAA